MHKFFASLAFLSLAHLTAAQFEAYPSCVQNIFTNLFPSNCLSTNLAAQNTCLCNDADTYAGAIAKGIYDVCGCSDLSTTTQLTMAYCAQVGINIGPAFSVATQDYTPCGGSSSSGGSNSGGSSNSGSSTSAAGFPASTSPASGSSSSPGAGTPLAISKGLLLGQIVGVGVAVAGGALAQGW